MIVPFSWLWEQLDGPIVTALRDGLYAYMYDEFNDKMDSLNELSIEDADSALLTVFGMLMGVPRPRVTTRGTSGRTMFQASYYRPSDYGFSQTPGPFDPDTNPGGAFSDRLETGEEGDLGMAPPRWYRAVLLAYADSEGNVGSLKLLDDVVTAVRSVDDPGAIPDHRFNWFMSSDTIHSVGDFEVYMSSLTPWADVPTASALIESIIYGSYAPVPRGSLHMDADISSSELSEMVSAQVNVDLHYPPYNWKPLVMEGDTVTEDQVVGTLDCVLNGGGSATVNITTNSAGEITYMPYDITNWTQSIEFVSSSTSSMSDESST